MILFFGLAWLATGPGNRLIRAVRRVTCCSCKACRGYRMRLLIKEALERGMINA